jgi:hypothetical protein
MPDRNPTSTIVLVLRGGSTVAMQSRRETTFLWTERPKKPSCRQKSAANKRFIVKVGRGNHSWAKKGQNKSL